MSTGHVIPFRDECVCHQNEVVPLLCRALLSQLACSIKGLIELTVFELYLNQDKNSETLEVQGLDRVVCPTQKFKFDRLEFASGEEQVGKFGIGKVEIAVTPSDAPAKSAPVKPASEKPAPAKPAPAKPAPEKPASEKK